MKIHKRLLSVAATLLIILLCAILLPTETKAVTEGYYTYTVSGGNATITGCDTSIDGSITIPSTLGGYPVTAIGNEAFYWCISLTHINIPDGVTSIGEGAFEYCWSLTNIEIPNSVTSIGNGAFYCCDSLISINIPNGVTAIGNEAFYGCGSLTHINIPDGVTSIGNGAFYCCDSLTSINIPNGVTNIGDEAFYCCDSLTSVNIPASVTSIGDEAFGDCFWLANIAVHADNGYYASENGVLFNKDKTLLIYYPNGKRDDATYQIPDGVISIGDRAFDNSNLTGIVIPNSVINIGSWAFDCSNLTSIEIPVSVASIGDEAFGFCNNLANIIVRADNGYYASENGVLFNKDKTLLICYPKGKTDETYQIPDGVTSIGDEIFAGCESLTSIYIPNSVTSIGDSAFWYCTSLTSIDIPNSVTSIGDAAFSNCESLTSVRIPDSLTVVGISMFFGCASLTNVDLPDSVVAIESDAFFLCKSLTSINIPARVTSIGNGAFYGCENLASINIPNSVSSIGREAFDECDSLTKVIYCGTRTKWDAIDIGEYNGALTEATLQFHNYQDGICTICGAADTPAPEEKLNAPKLTKVGTTLSWNAVEFADGYEIYRATSKSGKYTKVTTIAETTWSDSVAAGKTYYYKVKAIYTPDSTKNSSYSSVVSIDYKCEAPVLTVKAGSTGKPVLTWNKISGAKKYEIWRSVDGGAFKKLTTSTKLTYTDSKATAGAECTYKVKALGSKSAYNGEFSETDSCYVICAAPSVTLKLDSKTGKPALSWKKITGAKSYAIYRSANGGEYELLTTTTSVSYKDQSVQADNKYSYYVVTLGKAEVFNSVPSAAKSVTLAVKAPKLSGSANAEGKPVISWATVENAVSYKIYRSTKSSKGYTLLETTTDPSYTDTTVATGKTFYYKVVAVGTNTESAQSASLKLVGKCATPTIQVAINEDSGKPVISWEKIEGAKKYTVYRATSETGKYKKLGTTTKLTYTDSKASVGTKYFYKIVANPSSSSANSNYSNIESCICICAKAVVTAKVDAASGKPTLSWKKVTGAKTYEIYRSENGGEYILVATQTAVTYKDTTAVAGNTYSYQVKVISSKSGCDSLCSAEKTVTATCAQPKLKGKVGATGKPELTWGEVAGATKYVIYRSTSKSKGYKIIDETSDQTFTDTTATKGKTYYYKVVAVCEDAESAQSAYVKVKSK